MVRKALLRDTEVSKTNKMMSLFLGHLRVAGSILLITSFRCFHCIEVAKLNLERMFLFPKVGHQSLFSGYYFTHQPHDGGAREGFIRNYHLGTFNVSKNVTHKITVETF